MSASDVTPSLPRGWKIALSVLIVVHLWAVVSRPIEFATLGPFGASPSATLFRAPVRPYSQFAYLDHGYAFFAPDPGPSHLIEADITAADGTRTQRRYPDLQQQWPRLLYHRHFMLAEFLNDVYHPPGEPPPEVAEDPESLRAWRQSRRRYEAVRDSIVACLQKHHPESQITIRRLEHRPPGLPEFMERNLPLDAPELYRPLEDVIDNAPAVQVPAVPVTADPAPMAPPARRGGAEAVEGVR